MASRVLESIAVSERKREVVHLLARGLTIPEIAEETGISPRTIKAHVFELRMAFGGIRRRDIPKAWYVLTGENPYPTDSELEME
jgi:ATP/maltotriose-dependent transcriptional regulator MalT